LIVPESPIYDLGCVARGNFWQLPPQRSLQCRAVIP
jgi:hypothetical protein